MSPGHVSLSPKLVKPNCRRAQGTHQAPPHTPFSYRPVSGEMSPPLCETLNAAPSGLPAGRQPSYSPQSDTQSLLLAPGCSPGECWQDLAPSGPHSLRCAWQDRLPGRGSGSGANTLAVWARLPCQHCHVPFPNVR